MCKRKNFDRRELARNQRRLHFFGCQRSTHTVLYDNARGLTSLSWPNYTSPTTSSDVKTAQRDFSFSSKLDFFYVVSISFFLALMMMRHQARTKLYIYVTVIISKCSFYLHRKNSNWWCGRIHILTLYIYTAIQCSIISDYLKK